MRSYTTKHIVYTFDELSDEAKRTVLEKHYDINVNYDGWHNSIIDDWQEQLENNGLADVDIQYSGFWAQGDGASFTATIKDLPKFLKLHKLGNKYRLLANNADTVDASLERINNHYSHERTVRSDVNTYYAENHLSHKQAIKLEAQANEFEEWLDEWQEKTAKTIYKQLQEDYDYLTSEEAIIETIRANEYEFYENGIMA